MVATSRSSRRRRTSWPGRGPERRRGSSSATWRAASTTRVTVDVDGQQPAGGVHHLGSISGDGRHVAFESTASDLVADDGNGRGDIVLRDVVLGVTTRVSVDHAGADADGASQLPSVSADGSRVALWGHTPSTDRYDVFVS